MNVGTRTRLASLLAVGLRRWHEQRQLLGAENSENSAAGRLEVSPTTVLTVVTPVNGAGDFETTEDDA